MKRDAIVCIFFLRFEQVEAFRSTFSEVVGLAWRTLCALLRAQLINLKIMASWGRPSQAVQRQKPLAEAERMP